MILRSASVADAARILQIYAYYVENTAASFELVTPALDEFRERITVTLQRYPYIVAEVGDQIIGYAYAGPLSSRAAYDHSCEVSIYVDRNAKNKGIGRALYAELEARLKAMGILNLYACIASPIGEDEFLTMDSEWFHACVGYHKVGEFYKCGRKFGHWYNVVWMEKFIGVHV